MSLYSQYLKERENGNVLENEHGFLNYFIYGEECYIRDVYVIPSKRGSKIASDLEKQVHEIALGLGCKCLSGSVDINDKSATYNTQAMIQNGYKIHSLKGSMIYFMKEIK